MTRVLISGRAMSNVASTFGDLGRHKQALAMFEKALLFLRRVLPTGHPDIGEKLVRNHRVPHRCACDRYIIAECQ
jgi:hypothetical protein